MRMTTQPLFANISVIVLSCSMLCLILFDQKSSLFFGCVLRQLWPCQKQPSTKIATRFLKNTKSGCPFTEYPRRHPFMPCLWKNLIRHISVDLFLFDFILRIIAERFFLSYTSPKYYTSCSYHFVEIIIFYWVPFYFRKAQMFQLPLSENQQHHRKYRE